MAGAPAPPSPRGGATMPSLLALVLLTASASLSAGADAPTRPPNVLVFILDDVGMGDLGCFGNDTIKTPNIDGLASEGVRLTHNLVAPMCTPSRAALMTGRLPVRYHVDLRGSPRVLYFLSVPGVPSEEITMAEILKGAGYATALIGKWHLGVTCAAENSCSDPLSQGFDYFYGLPLTNLLDCGEESSILHAWARATGMHTKIAYTLGAVLAGALLLKLMGVIARRGVTVILLLVLLVPAAVFIIPKAASLGCVLMEDRDIIEQPLRYDHLTERLHSRAVQFMERHQDQPFLLVMSFVQAHTELFNNDQFRHHSVHGRYGDNLEEMDWSVGEVLASLKSLGLEDNTLVYLTSDNGGHVEEFTEDGERHGGWNGIYKGGKGSTWEGGIRVPAIFKLPGVIPSGGAVSRPTQVLDVLPTVAHVTGVELPADRLYDGKDLLPLLTDTDKSAPSDEFMFHYCGGSLNAVRYTPKRGRPTYKVHYATSRHYPGIYGIEGCFNVFLCGCDGRHVDLHDPPLVFDMTADPSEAHPLDSSNPKVSRIIAKVAKAVAAHRATLPEPPHPLAVWLSMTPLPWNRKWCGSFPTYTCVDPYLAQFKETKNTN